MSARLRILITMILLALLPVFLIGIVANSYMEKSLTTNQEDSLKNVAKVATRYMTDFYDEKYKSIENSAKIEPYERVLQIHNDNPDNLDEIYWEDLARKYIELDINANVGEGVLIGKNGEILISYNPSEEGLMIDKTKLYKTIIDGADKYKGAILGELGPSKMEIAVPIKNAEGKILGIFKRIISLQNIKEYINDIQIGATGYIYMLGNDGVIFQQENKEELGIPCSEFQDTFELNQLRFDFQEGKLESKEGTIKYTNSGINYLGVYEHLAESDWMIIAVIDDDLVHRQMAKVRSDLLIMCLIIGFAAAMVAYNLCNSITDPLKRLNMSVKKIAEGDLTSRCNYTGHKELKELSNNINYIADNLQRKEKELRMSVRIDKLTHLPNRHTIYEVLETLMYKHKNQALLMIDLDSFKMSNENLGHEIGDKILIEVGEILRSLPQEYCYPARLGGDEFLVFVTDWDIDKYPEIIADMIINEISNIGFIDDIRVNASVSIGIEYLTEEKLDTKKLIKHSDFAMYKAKATGKNRYVVYSKLDNDES